MAPTTKEHTIETVRRHRPALQAERDTLISAPLAHETIRAAVLATLTRAATDQGATLSRMLRFPDRGEGIRLHAPLKNAPATVADLTGLLAALFGPDALAAALDRYVLALPDGPAAAERSARLVAIADELERLEHIEEDLIEASGETIARLGDASPAVVLRVKETTDV